MTMNGHDSDLSDLSSEDEDDDDEMYQPDLWLNVSSRLRKWWTGEWWQRQRQ
jgi:hypothetical protein